MNIQRVARWGAIAITAITMTVLYRGLVSLAEEAKYQTWQAYLFPLSIDGTVLVAYLAAYSARRRTSRLYAGALVLVGAAASSTGQYLHSASIPGAPGWAPWVAVMPAVAAVLALHLAVILGKADHAAVSRETKVRPARWRRALGAVARASQGVRRPAVADRSEHPTQQGKPPARLANEADLAQTSASGAPRPVVSLRKPVRSALAQPPPRRALAAVPAPAPSRRRPATGGGGAAWSDPRLLPLVEAAHREEDGAVTVLARKLQEIGVCKGDIMAARRMARRWRANYRQERLGIAKEM